MADGRGQEEAAARTGEALAGPSPPASEETRASEVVKPPELDDFPLEQSWDETLKNAYDRVRSVDGQLLQPDVPLSLPYFSLINERLYRVTQNAQSKEMTTQLLVPRSRREMLFQASQCTPMAGHLGEAKTRKRLLAPFFWPGIHENVRRWCAACRECQLVNPPATAKAPLRPSPLMEVPFERIGMDLIGPLERSARGYRFALVLVDYATRYPEAVPLRSISAKSMAEALFRIISRVGIPKEILTDQGTAFMSRTLKELYELLGQMARAPVVRGAGGPTSLHGVFPIRAPVWSPAPGGCLTSSRRLGKKGPSNSRSEIQYVLDLRAKLHTFGRLSMENLLQAQDRQSRLYNRGARLRQFMPGDKVLVLLPMSSSKLLAKWQGPFMVTWRVGELDYEVKRTDRGDACQIYHLNLLKRWNEGTLVGLAAIFSNEDDLGPEAAVKSDLLALVSGGDHLSPRPIWMTSSSIVMIERHMEHLCAVLRSLRVAGLTANPRKCAIGRVGVRYLGFHFGHGHVRPQIDKSAAVAACPSPKTKKEVRQFLGLAGYYRRFIPNFSDLTSPLTDLTKKEAPDPVQWTELCQQAITKVKAALCGKAVSESEALKERD